MNVRPAFSPGKAQLTRADQAPQDPSRASNPLPEPVTVQPLRSGGPQAAPESAQPAPTPPPPQPEPSPQPSPKDQPPPTDPLPYEQFEETLAPPDDPEQYVDAQGREYFPEFLPPESERLVYEWSAPSRPFKERKKQFFTSMVTIVLLICLILFFAGQFLPIAVVVAVGFLAYVLATTPPHDIHIQISSFGIRMDDQLYYWEELGRFWFSEKFSQELLNIEVARFPFRLTMVLGEAKKEDLHSMLSEILVYGEPPATVYDKAGKWLQEKVPLEVEK